MRMRLRFDSLLFKQVLKLFEISMDFMVTCFYHLYPIIELVTVKGGAHAVGYPIRF
jgi:hypothetical protein